jgi:carbon-monoxide dehydrogenase medium subunit
MKGYEPTMAPIRAYHRPEKLEDALALVAHTDADATILAGGTVINGLPEEDPVDVVDLQALGLDQMEPDGGRLRIGAMVRLSDLVESELVPALLRDLARREAPNTLRNASTIGGTVAAAEAESELLAGLLAFGASVSIAHSIGSDSIPLGELLDDRSRLGLGIITSVTIDVSGDAAAERTGRSPADRPIVMAVGRRAEDGTLLLALTGVDRTPVLVGAGDIGGIQPVADFRGSVEYRIALARVLTARVMARLGEDV